MYVCKDTRVLNLTFFMEDPLPYLIFDSRIVRYRDRQRSRFCWLGCIVGWGDGITGHDPLCHETKATAAKITIYLVALTVRSCL
jgi:hypothetical protein